MSRELFKRGGDQERVSWSKNRRRVKRDWAGIAKAAFKVLCLAALAAMAVWAGPGLRDGLHRIFWKQETLAARKVILEGNKLVAREEILAALNIGAGENLLRMDVTELAGRLERIPAVKTASVRKQYPSALAVTVVERSPMMIVGEGADILVDDEGVFMGPVPAGLAGLPRVGGVEVVSGRVSGAAVSIIHALRQAAQSANLGWPGVFALIDLSTVGSPVGYLEGGVPIMLGRGDFEGKLKRLAYVLPQLKIGEARVAYLDLRFEARVVVGMRPRENNEAEAKKEQGETSG